eukprot:8769668-Alexandrium_andersonii.AAC.1
MPGNSMQEPPPPPARAPCRTPRATVPARRALLLLSRPSAGASARAERQASWSTSRGRTGTPWPRCGLVHFLCRNS